MAPRHHLGSGEDLMVDGTIIVGACARARNHIPRLKTENNSGSSCNNSF